MKPAKLITLALAATAALTACSGDKKKGPTIAKGKDVAITAAEFKAKLEEQSPFIRARYATLDRKKEFLENLIRFELLAAEAKRQKLDEDPEVQETLKKIMVQRLVRKSFDEDGAQSAGDDELRKYYDEHRDEFVKAERVRVSQIVVRAERSAPDRAARAADARKLLAQLKAEQARNPLAFASVARERSDDLPSKASGGDLGYRSREEIERAYGAPVAAAAFGLKNVGDETGIVESDLGFHVLKLAARQPALDRPFEEVRAQLAARLGREKRTRDFDAYVKTLREKSSIEISDAELEKVEVSAAPAPAAPGVTGASLPEITAVPRAN